MHFATPVPEKLEYIKQGEGDQAKSLEQEISKDEMLLGSSGTQGDKRVLVETNKGRDFALFAVENTTPCPEKSSTPHSICESMWPRDRDQGGVCK